MSAELGQLAAIKQIVVLMLENRSFDHMLGYLSLGDNPRHINGLKKNFANSHNGTRYPVHHLERTRFNADEDPDHSGGATRRQMNGDKMDGFVASYANLLASRNVLNPDLGLVMGYYDETDLPVYDHLAREFCVCDRWHSSV